MRKTKVLIDRRRRCLVLGNVNYAITERQYEFLLRLSDGFAHKYEELVVGKVKDPVAYSRTMASRINNRVGYEIVTNVHKYGYRLSAFYTLENAK